jgi:hypothetical protein
VIVAACSSPGAVVLDTPEGRVLQYEGDDALILVSGAQQSYRLGEPMRLNLMVNNQSTSPISVRLRTKLLGRGDQPVVQAEPALLDVRPTTRRMWTRLPSGSISCRATTR